MKKISPFICALVALLYLFLPFKVSDDEIIYVDNGIIWSGNIETNNFKTFLSRNFITNIFYIGANIVNEKRLYKINEDEYIFSLTYDKYNKRLYVITEDKYNNYYSIKEIYNNKEVLIKELDGQRRYFKLYYNKDRLYYWVDDKKQNYLEIFDLKKREIRTRIPVAKIGSNVNCFDNMLIFSSLQGKEKGIFAAKDDKRIKLFLKDMLMPIKISDTEMICLDGTNLNNIYLYDLKGEQRKLIGKNDGRVWQRYAFILSDRLHYITEKNISGYDIQEWNTINDLDGGMQILFVDGPMTISN